MEPEIRELSEKKLIGKHLRMSMTVNRTGELWKAFMPRRREIAHVIAPELLYSMQVYDADYNHTIYTPDAAFEKWAAVEVTQFDTIPEGMDIFTLTAGTYAVFQYRGGAPSEGAKIFAYIFSTWLPQSSYILDHRPHFELLGPKYKNNSPDSEEEIWIPVRVKIQLT